MGWNLKTQRSEGKPEVKRRSGVVHMKLSDGGAKELEAATAIKAAFNKMGIDLLRRPVGRSGEPLSPTLPSDLTTLNDVQLGRLFGEFCTMAQYAQQRLAVHAVARSVKEAAQKFLRSETRLRQTGTVADKSARVDTDPRVRDRAVAVLVDEGVETLTLAVLESYIIGRDALSREQTRRQTVFREYSQK